jgi:ornithine carbamoyltransferase
MKDRHFIDIDGLDRKTLRALLDAAHAMKKAGRRPPGAIRPDSCYGAVLLMVFEKASTRTRVSFDVAIRQLGGEAVVLNHDDLQLGRGESIADTARVLSRYGDVIMLRTKDHEELLELARHATIPVINGLSDLSHPCQIMADLMTLEEHKGPVENTMVAWVGDGNNVATSWIHAAARFGFALRLACPEELAPRTQLVQWAEREGARVTVTSVPEQAVEGADCVVTDTWVSMGDTDPERRMRLLRPYQVDENLMKRAAKDAIFLHCLPAYRGREVTAGVIDGPQSAVFDEAENRLHAQKAILAWCLGGH